jgi:putative oxidoreductase
MAHAAALQPAGRAADFALLLGRLLVVLQLVPNGLGKIANFAATAGVMGGTLGPQIIDGRRFPVQTPLFHFPAPELFLAASIVLDLAGALAIALGWRARAIAAIVAGYVLLAMTIYHGDIRDARDALMLLRNLPFLGGLLVVAAVGAGGISIDAWLARRTRP